jgi:hypothetical protein
MIDTWRHGTPDPRGCDEARRRAVQEVATEVQHPATQQRINQFTVSSHGKKSGSHRSAAAPTKLGGIVPVRRLSASLRVLHVTATATHTHV